MTSLSVRKSALGGLLIVLALMPFHAFISVWLGSQVDNMPVVQVWKDVLLALVAGLTLIMAWRHRDIRIRLLTPISGLVYAYVALGILISLITRPPFTTFIYGLKTDAEFLVAFICAYALAGPRTLKYATKAVIGGLVIVATFGALQALLLPKDILTWFGYGASTIQPYANLTAQVSSFRILSTLGGPNQLGSYLILPICLLVTLMLRRWRWWQPIILTLALVTLWHTYSRSAWLATAIALTVTVAIELPRRWRKQALVAGGVVAILLLIGVALSLTREPSLQAYILHGNLNQYGQIGSDAERIESQENGLKSIIRRPLGQGLGSSGPASKYGPSYTITENYYLQLAAEVGLAGLAIFVSIQILVGLELWRRSKKLLPAAALLGSLVGISIINFLLHGWADSSTALIFWIYAGLALGVPRRPHGE